MCEPCSEAGEGQEFGDEDVPFFVVGRGHDKWDFVQMEPDIKHEMCPEEEMEEDEDESVSHQDQRLT